MLIPLTSSPAIVLLRSAARDMRTMATTRHPEVVRGPAAMEIEALEDAVKQLAEGVSRGAWRYEEVAAWHRIVRAWVVIWKVRTRAAVTPYMEEEGTTWWDAFHADIEELERAKHFCPEIDQEIRELLHAAKST